MSLYYVSFMVKIIQTGPQADRYCTVPLCSVSKWLICCSYLLGLLELIALRVWQNKLEVGKGGGGYVVLLVIWRKQSGWRVCLL
jgi:hypothetical protein